MLVTVNGDRLEVRDGADPSRPGVEINGPGGTPVLTQPEFYDLSDDGSAVVAVAAGQRPTVYVADAGTGQTTWSSTDLESTGDSPPLVTLSPDGARVLVADRGWNRLRMWDVATGALAGEVAVADVEATSTPFNGRPRFSPDRRYVDVVTLGSIARLSATDLQPVQVVAAPFQLQGEVGHLPTTQDVVVSGSAGRLARIDMANGDVVATGQSPDPSGLFGVAASPDGSLVVSLLFSSHRLAVFDAATLQPIGEPIPVGDQLFVPQFTPQGLLGNGLNNDLTRWDMAPASWLRTACTAAGRDLTEEEWTQYLGADEPYRETCE